MPVRLAEPLGQVLRMPHDGKRRARAPRRRARRGRRTGSADLRVARIRASRTARRRRRTPPRWRETIPRKASAESRSARVQRRERQAGRPASSRFLSRSPRASAAVRRRAEPPQPLPRFCLLSMRSSTTAGSARVEVSPSAPYSFSAILRKMRRMILPERVFGNSAPIERGRARRTGRSPCAPRRPAPCADPRSARRRSSGSHRRRCPAP